MAINKDQILINGAAYDWASLTISFGLPELADQIIWGASKLDYENDMPITNNFGKGRLPVSYGRQNITATATMTISAEEFHKLEDVAPDNVIQDLPKFDVIAQYVTADGNTRTDIIRDCHLTKDGRSLSQNDPESKIDMELNPSFIDFNV